MLIDRELPVVRALLDRSARLKIEAHIGRKGNEVVSALGYVPEPKQTYRGTGPTIADAWSDMARRHPDLKPAELDDQWSF